MLTKSSTRKEEHEEERDLKLENIVGNLLIAEYQVDKLRSKLTDMISRYGSISKCNKASVNVFKHNNSKWYKISLRIDDMTTTTTTTTTTAEDVIDHRFSEL
jgi:hypothetical protein